MHFLDLQKVISRSYTPKPITMLLRNMFDVKAWIEPAMEGLHNIIYPHCFEIFSGEDGRIKLKYKKWSRDAVWLPEIEDGINILKVIDFFVLFCFGCSHRFYRSKMHVILYSTISLRQTLWIWYPYDHRC